MGLLKRIHVNQHAIRANSKGNFGSAQVFTIKYRGDTLKAQAVRIDGPSEVVYRPNAPLSCGARVWIETHEQVTLDPGQGFEVVLI